MAEKNVTIIIGENGKIIISFNGFEGNSCYTEGEKIKADFEAFGVKIENEVITPNENTVEAKVTKVPNEFKH